MSFGSRTLKTLLFGLLLGTACLGPGSVPASSQLLEFIDHQIDANLYGADQLAIPADGQHIYAYGSRSLVFERNRLTGELRFVDGIAPALDLAFSPDGRFLYSYISRRLRVLARDKASGSARWVEAWGDPVPGLDRLTLSSTAISPDGKHLYATAYQSALLSFSRNSETGVLDHTHTLFDGLEGVTGLETPVDLAVSPDGEQVYVINRTTEDASNYSVAAFDRDATTGALRFIQAIFADAGGVEALRDAGFVRVSSDGRHVYVAGTEGIVSFARDGVTGELRLVGVYGDEVDALAISPDGRYLYTVDNRETGVAIFARDPATGALEWLEIHSEGIADRRGVDAVAMTSDGRHIYLLGSSWIASFARDPSDGDLDLIAISSDDVEGDIDGLIDPNDLTGSPDGRHLYVTTEFGGVKALSRSAETGEIESVATYEDLPGIEDSQAVTVSPEGRNVYVVSGHPDHALAVFGRDETTGELDYLEAHFDDQGGVDGLEYAHSVTVSPDARHVYVASTRDHAVAAFERDVTDGRLSFLAAYFDGVGPIDGLSSARSIVVSPEGAHVYVAGPEDRAVAAFERDARTGQLEFIEAQLNGETGTAGLAPDALIVSSNGHQLYALSSGAVTTLGRDPASGRLHFLQALSEGLRNPRRLTASPGGKYVYVFGDEIAVLARNPEDGTLALVEANDLPHYDQYRGIAGTVSPDGQHLYIASEIDRQSGIVTLRRTEGLCQPGPYRLCLGDNRFRAEIDWRDQTGQTGSARGVAYSSDDSGLFWFFDSENWEMLIKVLDGCALNDRFWIFAAATTDVEYTLRVTDLKTDITRRYFNPLGSAAPSITDIEAFATCNAGTTSAGHETSRFGAERTHDSAVETSSAFASPGIGTKLELDGSAQKDEEPRHLVVGLGEKCLDVEGAVTIDGAPINIFSCHRGANQRWQFEQDCGYPGCTEDFEIQGSGGKCLQPATPSSSGTPLVLGPCGGGDEMRWLARGVFPHRFQLEHVESGLCADVEGADAADGTPAQLFECHDGANQIWRYEEVRCFSSPLQRCLNQGRFQIEVEWRDFAGNTGRGRAARQGTDDSGIYWFFTPDNWEMLIKVLDGCAINGQYWVFAASTTNVEFTLRVTDTETGRTREYFNPLGLAASAITDTSAFASCR